MRAAFELAPCHEHGKRLADRIVHPRRLETGDDLFDQVVRAFPGPDPAGRLPAFIIHPIAEGRPAECCLLMVLGVLDAKEVTIDADRFDRVECGFVRTGRADGWIHMPLNLLQCLTTHKELLRKGDLPSLKPACW